MNMLKSMSLTIHTYNQETIDEITDKVFNSYYKLFCELELYFNDIINK